MTSRILKGHFEGPAALCVLCSNCRVVAGVAPVPAQVSVTSIMKLLGAVKKRFPRRLVPYLGSFSW